MQKPWEKEENKNEEPKQKSFLFSLYQKFKLLNNGEEKEQELISDDEPEKMDEAEAEEDISALKDTDPLVTLYKTWKGEKGTQEVLHIEDFLSENVTISEELNFYFREIRELSRKTLAALVPKPDDESVLVIDSSFHIKIFKDRMTAYGFLFPPINGGKCPTIQEISCAIVEAGISYGLIDGIVEQIIEKQVYLKWFVIARGLPAKNGENGKVEELIPHTAGSRHILTGQDIVDFKNLNWLVQIKEGDVICNIFPPTEPINGYTVLNEIIAGMPGKKAFVPMGKNTGLNEDGTALVARSDGQVSYFKEKYKIDQLVTVDGNIDLSTGNLTVTGNILVKGDVCDGFVIQASGDITVEGIVEGATVIAGGNIFVKRGMNGNSDGKLKAGKDIKCIFLENGTAIAEGNIYMESIVNSNLECSGQVIVKSGRGVIIGGSISALELIEAKIIGNVSNRPITIIIGRTPEFIKEKNKVEEDLEKAQSELDALLSQINNVEKSRMEETAHLVSALRPKLPIAQMRVSNLQKQFAILQDKEKRAETSHLMAGTLYPVARITLDGITKIIYDMNYNINVFKKDGEIYMGTK